MSLRNTLMLAAVLTIALGAAPATTATKPTTQPKSPTTKKVTFDSVIRGRIADALADLDHDADFTKATQKLTDVFDQITLNAPDKSEDLFRDADFALRLVSQIEQYNESKRVALFKYLRANESLARTLAFAIRPDEQKPDVIYALLDRLRGERAKLVPKYVYLTTAICVVHAVPLVRHINENVAEAVDPIEIFDYFVQNENKMFFGIKNVPPELLIYVVDTTASVKEMRWALAKYTGNAMIGGAFFDVPYDYDHFTHGTEKKITKLGFILPNIQKYGGVCADQAYYAMSVGKSIGVPTAYCWGAAGESSHAWVGYLQNIGKRGIWNFDEGRYEAYRGVRGHVLDPQTRQDIPDSYVSLLADMIGTRIEDRHAAIALTDATKRLMEREDKLESYADAKADEIPGSRAKPRTTDTPSEMALLDLALRQNAAYAPAWLVLRDMASAKKMSLDQKRIAADALTKQCGKYPDFTFDILKPMIETIPDVNEQNKIWNAAFNMFQNRPDLAAAVRMAQADLWESKNETAKAGQCYEDVIGRFTNAGPFVIEALARAEKLLVDSNKAGNVVLLYEQAWKKIPRPIQKSADPYMHQSNWYRVGQLYAQKLQQSGQLAKADNVLMTIDGGNAKGKPE